MANHDVTFTVPERPVGNVDIEFPVRRGGSKFGTLKVSKGGIEWVPSGCTKGHHLTWKETSGLVQEHGRRKD